MDVESNSTSNIKIENQASKLKKMTCRSGRLCRLEEITPLAKQLNCLEMKKVADICVNEISELIGAKLASLYVLEDNSDILHLEKHNHPFLINHIVSLNQNPPSPMVVAVRTRELMLIENFEGNDRPVMKGANLAFAKNYDSNSCIIAPLICHGKVVGVLNLADKQEGGSFTAEDVSVVELFRQLVGASIGNIKLFEKSQKLARTDGLTGLVNHRTFYDTLERELRRSQRFGGNISVIMVDMDGMKPINDNNGHRAGDLAIRTVARKISACIRKIDIAARYGGDEFAVILPNTSLADASVVANRIVKAVNTAGLKWEGEPINLSVSVGVGEYDSSSCPEEITRKSDEALYEAKLSGKNNVKVFSGVEN